MINAIGPRFDSGQVHVMEEQYLTTEEHRKAVELGMALVSEYIYRQEYTVWNELEGKDQKLAFMGVLNVAAKLVMIMQHAKQDETIEETMSDISTVIYMNLEESLKDDE